MSIYNQYKQSILDEADEIIQPAIAKLAEIENPSQVLVKEPPSFSAILTFAKESDCDFIIMMGSRELSGIKEFLGSVSHLIIQKSPIPVMLMKS